MAKRMSKTVRDRFYNQGGTYQLVPTLRREVVPGMTVSGDFKVKMQTAAFSKNLLTGALFEHQLFYVPYRLLWDDWVKFITRDDDYAGTWPTSATDWTLMWDHAGSHLTFFRRAYKLIYNTYFGSHYAEDAAGGGSDITFYDDITDDTDVDVHRLMTTEQMAQKMWYNEERETPTYDGTTVAIDLLAFDEALKAARSGHKNRIRTGSGNLYVDMLRSMGVQASYSIQQKPERLSKSMKELDPVKTFDTSATSVGESAARYEGTISHRMPNKSFAEHGLLVGLAFVRPHVFNDALETPWDAKMHFVEDVDSFWLGDNETGRLVVEEPDVATGVDANDEFLVQRFQHLWNGQHQSAESAWANTATAADFVDYVFPASGSLPVGNELSGHEIALNALSTLNVKLPMRQKELY